MKLRVITSLCCLLFASAAFCQDGGSAYNLAKVMESFRTPKPGLVTLSAHRGYWRLGQENSLTAFEAALMMQFESLEIDVRLSRQGHLWLLHDLVLDRHTNGHGTVTSSYDNDMFYRALRDRFGSVTTLQPDTTACGKKYHLYANGMLSFHQMLLYMGCYDHNVSKAGVDRGFALVVDVKPPWESLSPALTQMAALKNGLDEIDIAEAQLHADGLDFPIHKYVVFKLQGKEIPTDETKFWAEIAPHQEVHLVAVLYGDTKSPADREHEQAIIDNYLLKQRPFLVTVEVGIPFAGRQPDTTWLSEMKQHHFTITGFPAWPDYPEGTAYVWATCCNYRNTNPLVTSPGLNYGGNPEFWLQMGATWITADQAPSLMNLLKALDLRHTEQIQ